MLTREILKWTEKKFDKVMEDEKPEDFRKNCLKAAGLGAIEGFIDGAVILAALSAVKGIIGGMTGRNGK